MSRLTRPFLEEHCYHTISATYARKPIFRDTHSAQVLLSAIDFIRQDHAFVLAYSVMPDHMHLVLVPRSPFDLSKTMQSIKGYTSRVINASNNKKGRIWQQSFYDRLIRDEKQLENVINYVHMNALQAGLTLAARTIPILFSPR